MAYDPVTNGEGRKFNLTMIEGKGEVAYARILDHKGMVMKNYNQRVKSRQLQVGDLVLKQVEVSRHVGKADPG